METDLSELGHRTRRRIALRLLPFVFLMYVIDIEEGHVVEGELMKEEDELHKVGVGLLPDEFLAFAEQVVVQ